MIFSTNQSRFYFPAIRMCVAVNWSDFGAESLFQWALQDNYSGWLKRAADAGHELAREIQETSQTSETSETSEMSKIMRRYFFPQDFSIAPTDEEISLCSPYLHHVMAERQLNDEASEFLWYERGAEAGCLHSLAKIVRFSAPLVLHPYEWYDQRARQAFWPEMWVDLDFDSSVDPYAWALRTKKLDDWFSGDDYLALYDLNMDQSIKTLNNVEAYYLGKVGCRFASQLFGWDLHNNSETYRSQVSAWYLTCGYEQACFTVTGCLRRLLPNRDVRRLILQRCNEKDWILRGHFALP